MPDFWSGYEWSYVIVQNQTDGSCSSVCPGTSDIVKAPVCPFLWMKSLRPSEQPQLTLKFCGKTRKQREIVPGSSWGRQRGLQAKYKNKMKKADQWWNTEAKTNTSVFWKRPTSRQQQRWQTAAGWRVDSVITKNRVTHLRLADVLLTFTSPSRMTLIICS